MELGQLNLAEYPKVELHRHLEGAVRFSTLIELSNEKGPIQDLKNKFLVQQPMKDLAAVLNKFLLTQSVLKSQEILTRVTFEAIEDACVEGVRILELRYAPTYIQKNHPNLSFSDIHQAVLKGLSLARPLPIAVGLICILQRTSSKSELDSISGFILENKDSFVGVDLADDEEAAPAKSFLSYFEKFQKAGIPITIHAGETPTELSPLNVMDAINLLGAQRIGHGLQIIHNKKAIQLVKDRKIPLEICVHSNWLTNAISSPIQHPIRNLIQLGIPVTINSDDPGIFGTNLTHDYKLLRDHYGFQNSDFDLANDLAAWASFLPLSEKQKYWPRKINPPC